MFTALVFTVAACGGGSDGATDEGASFVIQDGDVVEAHYVLTLDDGSTVESSRDLGVPFTFTVGDGSAIIGFDSAVVGKRVGDVSTVRIESADAAGPWNPANVFEVEIAPSQEDVTVGDVVYLPQRGVVIEVNGSVAKVDTNLELAGEALTLEIEVLAVTRG